LAVKTHRERLGKKIGETAVGKRMRGEGVGPQVLGKRERMPQREGIWEMIIVELNLLPKFHHFRSG